MNDKLKLIIPIRVKNVNSLGKIVLIILDESFFSRFVKITGAMIID